ncbi:MAG: hypothetical protein U0W24_02260 [Bacteroidales bacterium]
MTIWAGEIQEIEKLYTSFKGQIPDLDKEIEPLLKTDDAIVIMVYSRRCLEILVTDLCETELKRPRKTQPLKGIIDLLNSENKVPEHIVSSMHSLNSLSAYGAHPKDFEPEQIKTVLINLSIIIKWYLKYKNTGLGSSAELIKTKQNEIIKQKIKSNPLKKTKIIIGVSTSIVLLAILISFIYPNIFRQNELENLASLDRKIAVAVMPFSNMTGDSTWNNYQTIIQQSLISSLTTIGSNDLKVRLQTNINNSLYFSGKSENTQVPVNIASEISKKLDADILIYGLIQKSGSGLSIVNQLIDTKSNEIIKSISTEGQYSEKSIFDMIEANQKKVTDFLIQAKILKENTPYGFDYKYSITTTSPEAVRYFYLGKKAQETNNPELALEYFLKANAIDSNYYDPYIEIPAGYGYIQNAEPEQNYRWLIKTYNKRDKWPEYERLLASWEYAFTFEAPEKACSYLEQIQKMDDQDISSSRLLAISYSVAKQYENAIREYAHFRELYTKWDKNWDKNEMACGDIYFSPGYALFKTGQYKKARELFDQAEKIIPDHPWVSTYQAVLAFIDKDTARANDYIEKYKVYKKKNLHSEAATEQGLGDIYCQAGMLEKADGYYHKALLLEPKNAGLMKAVSDYYIEYNRNLNEIPELMDRAMKLAKSRLDLYTYMDTKGWAYYKMGKNKEALAILQKVWDEAPYKIYTIKSHYEEVKKAIAIQN